MKVLLIGSPLFTTLWSFIDCDAALMDQLGLERAVLDGRYDDYDLLLVEEKLLSGLTTTARRRLRGKESLWISLPGERRSSDE